MNFMEETGEIWPHSVDKEQQQGEHKARDTIWPNQAQGTHV